MTELTPPKHGQSKNNNNNDLGGSGSMSIIVPVHCAELCRPFAADSGI